MDLLLWISFSQFYFCKTVQKHLEDEVIMPFESENHFCGEKMWRCKEIRTISCEGILNFFQKTFDDKITVLSEIHAKFLIFFSVLIYINQRDSRIMPYYLTKFLSKTA